MADPYRERLIAARAGAPDVAFHLPRRIPVIWNWLAWVLAALGGLYFVMLLVDLLTQNSDWLFRAISAALMLMSLYFMVASRTRSRVSAIRLLETIEKIAEFRKGED